GQELNDKLQKKFLSNFGHPFIMKTDQPTLGSDVSSDSLIVIGNQAPEFKNAYLGAQEVLPHSDHQWLEEPSSISGLYAIDIASHAAPTVWFDMEEAYNQLSDELKRTIENLNIITFNPFFRPFGSVTSKYVNREIDIPQ